MNAEKLNLDELVQLTGLPENLVMPILKNWIEKAGLNVETLSTEDMRRLLAQWMGELFVELAQETQ